MFEVKQLLAIFGVIGLIFAGLNQTQAETIRNNHTDKSEPKVCRIVKDTLLGKVICYVDCKKIHELLEKGKHNQDNSKKDK